MTVLRWSLIFVILINTAAMAVSMWLGVPVPEGHFRTELTKKEKQDAYESLMSSDRTVGYSGFRVDSSSGCQLLGRTDALVTRQFLHPRLRHRRRRKVPRDMRQRSTTHP